jgi:Arc-like DNA binding domain
MARKTKARRPRKSVAQIKVRLPELLRRDLEQAAKTHGQSMNVEMVQRLNASFQKMDAHKLIAAALLDGLDDAVVEEMVNTVNRQIAEDDYADDLRHERQIEEAWENRK